MLKLLSKDHDSIHEFTSQLDEIARLGAKKMLAYALDLEVEEYINQHANEVDESGHRKVVRNGNAKQRKVQLGAGTVNIKAPRVDDRREGQKFTSQILPPYFRKSPNVENLIPILYLRGLSTNDFKEALKCILGEGADGLSPASIVSIKKKWERDFEVWRKRPVNDDYVYVWADGVNVNIRIGEDKKICLLVIIGVNTRGEKHLLSVEAGYRESKDSWLAVMNDLTSRGFKSPALAIADGALGFWSAIRSLEDFKDIKEQRCWVHKIANVLDKLPKRMQPQVKQYLHDMMRAENKASANLIKKQFDLLLKDKYEKSYTCLEKDWHKMITFFDFPASHWKNIRTTNPIESAFATVKLRTKSTRGAGSVTAAKTMAFKLLLEAEKKWKKLGGIEDLTNIKNNLAYKDGFVIYKNSENQEATAM